MSLTTLRETILAPNLPFKVNEIIDITDKLPKNPKGDWLTMPIKRKNGELETGPRPFEDVTHISVHHTAVEGGTPYGHANYHIRKGDGGIAYHIYIRDNQIYQTNDLLAFTWHTQSNNYQTIGIAVEGDFTKRSLSDSERNNLYAAIVTVMNIFAIPVENVRGHGEYYATRCPGFDMNRVRSDIKDILEQMHRADSWDNKLVKASKVINEINYWRKLVELGEADERAVRGMDNFIMTYDLFESKGKIPR